MTGNSGLLRLQNVGIDPVQEGLEVKLGYSQIKLTSLEEQSNFSA